MSSAPSISVLIATYNRAEVLRQTLEANGWNVVETARRLDVARSHVYKLITAFGLERGRK